MSTQHLRTFGRTCQYMNHITDKIKMPLPHCIFQLWLLYLCPPLEHYRIFKVSRVHPGSLCIEQQSSTAEESLAGGRGRWASIEFQGQFFDILNGVQQINID